VSVTDAEFAALREQVAEATTAEAIIERAGRGRPRRHATPRQRWPRRGQRGRDGLDGA
jgi:hypothetical protein